MATIANQMTLRSFFVKLNYIKFYLKKREESSNNKKIMRAFGWLHQLSI